MTEDLMAAGYTLPDWDGQPIIDTDGSWHVTATIRRLTVTDVCGVDAAGKIVALGPGDEPYFLLEVWFDDSYYDLVVCSGDWRLWPTTTVSHGVVGADGDYSDCLDRVITGVGDIINKFIENRLSRLQTIDGLIVRTAVQHYLKSAKT